MVLGLSDFSRIARSQHFSKVDNSKCVQAEDKNLKQEAKADIVGAGVGLMVPAYSLYSTFKKVTPQSAKKIADFMKDFVPEADTIERTKEVANKILEESGLKAKGVKLNFIDKTPESLAHLKEIMGAESSHGSALGRRLFSNNYETFKEGANAMFLSKSNEIVVNSKNLYSSVYHELGHSMNKNGNWFTKALQKSRAIIPFGVSLLAPVLLATGLLHKVDKTKPKEQKGKIERVLDFVSDNAGKLTLASYIPLVAEEGLASIRGLKAAAKYLPKDVVKKLGVNYLKNWGTYAATAAAISGGVALGVSVANKIKEKKQA